MIGYLKNRDRVDAAEPMLLAHQAALLPQRDMPINSSATVQTRSFLPPGKLSAATSLPPPILHLGARVRSSCRFSFAARPSRPAPVASNTPSSKDSDCIDCSSPEKTDTKNCLRCGISDWLRRLHIDEAESFRTRLDDGRRDPVCYSAYFADIVSSSRHQPTSSTKDELASGA
jgi:hypothetical protein